MILCSTLVPWFVAYNGRGHSDLLPQLITLLDKLVSRSIINLLPPLLQGFLKLFGRAEGEHTTHRTDAEIEKINDVGLLKAGGGSA